MVVPRICLLASFPIHRLQRASVQAPGHHATWLYPLAREWESSRAFEIHWITCTKAVSRPETFSEWGQTFHLLPRWKLSAEVITAFASERLRIANCLGKLQPDLVHAWGTEEGYGYAAIDWDGKHLLSMQGLLQVYCNAAPQPHLLRLQAYHEKMVLRRVRHLTVESPWGREHLARLAPHASVDLLEYGVEPVCFNVVRQPSKRPFALFVGTLNRLKGFDILLEAFSDPRMRHIELVVLGDGPLRAQAVRCPRNIKFMGHVAPEKVRELMAKAWCLVHPTRADTSPNCVKEACAIGLPVLTTPEGGQTQYVHEGLNGAYFPAGSVEDLIDAVLKWFVPEGRTVGSLVGRLHQLTPSATRIRLEEIIKTILDE